MADPPTTLCVTVDLSYAGVHPDAHGTDECCFTEVGSESGPEVVIQVLPSVKCAVVKRKPMSNSIEEHSDDYDRDDEEEEEEPKSDLLGLASTSSLRVESRLIVTGHCKRRRIRLNRSWGIGHRFSSLQGRRVRTWDAGLPYYGTWLRTWTSCIPIRWNLEP